jgi:hypothetical protein
LPFCSSESFSLPGAHPGFANCNMLYLQNNKECRVWHGSCKCVLAKEKMER